MKRKIILVSLFIMTVLLLISCSSNDADQDTSQKSPMNSTESSSNMDHAGESFADRELVAHEDSGGEIAPLASEPEEFNIDRMIIQTAHLHILVKDFNKTQLNFENKVVEYGGYIVESNVYRENDQQLSGHMTVRIPEKHFQKFLTDTEEQAAEVLERNVSGQDVTEQYVDLESRLTSKRVVEERLLAFMKDAEKTEDLLKISNDLATVQEDIEVIVGKMNYLENQSAYSTIDISMREDRIIIPGLDKDDLNTWEKTKKQLATSLNFLLTAGSGFIVFFVGNLPVIVLVAIVGVVGYMSIRKRIKMK